MYGISRQVWYKQLKKYNNNKHTQEVIHAAVSAIRSKQPRIGGRKLHFMLTDILAANKIKMGRDKLFKFLYNNHLINNPKKKIQTTDSSAWANQYPDLYKGIVATHPNQFWVSDITYLNLTNGFVYLALVSDVYSRMVIGYALSDTLTTETTCLPALEMALSFVPIQQRLNLIHHSDRGRQYISQLYCQRLEAEQIQISITQTGNPQDNAIAERINGILKKELLPPSFKCIKHATHKIKEAIDTYNTIRPHTCLKLNTPLEVQCK
jgi:transposase InsO family protein